MQVPYALPGYIIAHEWPSSERGTLLDAEKCIYLAVVIKDVHPLEGPVWSNRNPLHVVDLQLHPDHQ
jgi:hypothetical protein